MELKHRSNSNQCSDYITIFVSLFTGFQGQKFQNLKSSFVGHFIFLHKLDTDTDYIPLETWNPKKLL